MDRVFDRFIDSPDPPASPIENEGMAWLGAGRLSGRRRLGQCNAQNLRRPRMGPHASELDRSPSDAGYLHHRDSHGVCHHPRHQGDQRRHDG